MPGAQTCWFEVAFEVLRIANWAAAHVTCVRRRSKRWGLDPIKNPTPPDHLGACGAHNLQLAGTHDRNPGTSARDYQQRTHTDNVAARTAHTACIWQGLLPGAATSQREPGGDACPIPLSSQLLRTALSRRAFGLGAFSQHGRLLGAAAHAMANHSSRIV